MSFRDNLQYLRAQRNFTQERLAMLLGVSRQAISKWESGKAYPEMDKLLMICDLFGCTLDDLVLGSSHALCLLGIRKALSRNGIQGLQVGWIRSCGGPCSRGPEGTHPRRCPCRWGRDRHADREVPPA